MPRGHRGHGPRLLPLGSAPGLGNKERDFYFYPFVILNYLILFQSTYAVVRLGVLFSLVLFFNTPRNDRSFISLVV